ncbi:MAG TPA: hypothetical protein VMF56_09120 [Acidobacteriaceae bacterium]|nr:hypothetical protein [Acidobacteriaceae bacterium]
MSVWLHIVLPVFLETLVLSVALYCVYRAQKNRIYPAFWQFLFFSTISQAIQLVDLSLNGLHLLSGVHAYYIYFYIYWVSFGVSAVLILRVLHEMFRHAVRSIPGVQKLGEPIFFWAITISVILAFASGITPHTSGMSLLLASAQVLMRSQSVLALCMLTFLAFASNTLGVPFRSRIFGVTFGFGLMAVGDLGYTALFTYHSSLASAANIGHEAIYLGAIALWSAYFLQPEPARRLVTMPVTSPLMRWNDVAQTLGNPAGQVAVSYPPSFMTDVFDLVENVMGPNGRPQRAVSPPGPVAS